MCSTDVCTFPPRSRQGSNVGACAPPRLAQKELPSASPPLLSCGVVRERLVDAQSGGWVNARDRACNSDSLAGVEDVVDACGHGLVTVRRPGAASQQRRAARLGPLVRTRQLSARRHITDVMSSEHANSFHSASWSAWGWAAPAGIVRCASAYGCLRRLRH